MGSVVRAADVAVDGRGRVWWRVTRHATALGLAVAMMLTGIGGVPAVGASRGYSPRSVRLGAAEGVPESVTAQHAADVAAAGGRESSATGEPVSSSALEPLPVDGSVAPTPDPKAAAVSPVLPPVVAPPRNPTVEIDPKSVREVKGFEAGKSVELVGLRDAFTTTYQNLDGTRTVDLSSMPVHYKDARGVWTDVDNRVVADGKGGLTNAANEWRVTFGPMRAGEGVAVSTPDGDVRFTAVGAAAVKPTVEPDGKSVRYRNVFPDTDLVYLVTGSGIEELLVVKSAKGTPSVSFAVDGAQFDSRPGQLAGRGSKVAQRIRVSSPETFDAQGRPVAHEHQVFSSRNDGAGKSRVTVGVTSEFVKSLPADAFPLTVDPSIAFTIGASWVHSFANHSNGNGYGYYNDGYARIGNPAISSAPTVRWRSTAFFDYSAYNWASVIGAEINTTVVGGTSAAKSMRVGWADQDGFHYGTTTRYFTQYSPPSGAWVYSPNSYLVSTLGTGSATHSNPTAPVGFDDLYNNWTRTGSWGGTLLFTGDETPSSYTTKKFAVSVRLTVNWFPNVPTSNVSTSGRTVTWSNVVTSDPDGDALQRFYRVFSDANGNGIADAGDQWVESDWVAATSWSLTVPLWLVVLPNLRAVVYSRDGLTVNGERHERAGVPVAISPVDAPPTAPTVVSPTSGSPVPTLTPTLSISASTDPDTDPLQYQFWVCPAGMTPSANAASCRQSSWSNSLTWVVPSGFLRWNEVYDWFAFASDGVLSAGVAASLMPTKTAADVAAIGGGFNPYSADAVGVDPANGNFRFSTTDISIPAVGTPLAITRTMDTLLMSGTSVVNGAFGKGWMFPLDMKIRTDTDGNAFVVLPDGREEFHGKNPDGSYSRALGASTILTKDATRWHLQELSGTIYDFDVAEGKLLQATDKVGHVLSSAWPTTTTQVLTDVASGRSLTLTYDAPVPGQRQHIQSVATASVAAHGGALVWRYYYSGDLLVKACNPQDNNPSGKCEVYGYDTGRLVTITGVRGNLHTTLTYDTAGRVSTRADALGNTWTFGWVTPNPTITSPTGASITVHRATVTDPLSHTTMYDFDDARRLIHRAGPDGTHRWYSFDGNGFVNQFINELGQVEQYTNDAFGNVTARLDSAGQNWESGFDANGSMLWAEDAESHRTTFTYVNGLKMSETTPLGAVTAWTYTAGTEAAYPSPGTMPAGLLRTVTDPLGHVTVINDYNAAGDLTRTTDAAGKQTITTYDEIGRPVSTSTVWSGRNGSTTTTSTTTYDALSRVVTVIDPVVVNPVSLVSHQQRTTNVYDDNGNLTQVTVDDTFGNDQPRVTVFGYDADDRQTSSLDSENGTTTRTFDGAGNVIEVIDPLDRKTQTTYDAANRPLNVILKDYTNPAAPAAPRDIMLSNTTYDALGREATITDAIGNVTAFTYDVRGNRIKAELLDFQPLTGATYNFVLSLREYNPANRLVAEESGNGAQRVEYLYDIDGRRTTETFKVGPVAGFTLPDKVVATEYDAASNITKTTISDGVHNTEERRYSYDAANRPLTTTVENGATDLVTYATYDQLGNPETVVDARGSSATDATYMTINSYDILGRLFKTELPAVSIEAFGVAATTARPTKLTGRNTFGDTTHTVDGAGNTTTAAYDRLGRQTTITAPVYTQPGSSPATLQPTEIRSYDAVGNLIASTDRRGNTTDFEFDSLNRATRQTAPAANPGDPRAVSTVTYGDSGLVLARTDAHGVVTDYTYDKLGRVRTVTEHVTDNGVVQALVTTNDYDGAGNQISSTDPTGATTTAVYDRTGQQLRTTDPLGYVTTFEYDVAGRQTKVTSPSGASTRTAYDLAGRAIESAAYTATGLKLLWTTAGYDNVGNKVTSTDKVGTTTTYTYDATNALTGVAQPVAAGSTIATGYGYDANGNNTRVTDGNGHVWWTTYNPWGLTESRIEPVTTAYPDLVDRTFTTRYDSGGLPVKEFQPGVTINRTFDARGQLAAESSDGGGNRAFSYDLAGRPTLLTSGSTSITLGYNERNQLIDVAGSAGNSAFRYDAAGRTIEREDAAGTTSYSWNPNGQLYQIGDPVTGNTITYSWAAPGTANAGSLTTVATGSTTRTYGYDSLDRVTSDTTTAGANTLWSAVYGYDSNTGLVQSKTIAPAGVAGAGTNGYSYDLAGRLTGWVNPANVTTGYTYDGAGNRTSNGATAIVFDERNRIVSEGAKNYVWDARGTLDTISDGTSSSSYTFDGLGRMTSVGGVGYSYDALDRIITRAGVTFTYSGLNNQPTSDGTTVLSRSPDGSALAVAQGATRLNLLADRHGDVIAATTSAGVVTDTVAFTPWGEQAARQGSTALTVGFQGSYTDPTTGLIDMGARWYQASTGTFTNRDTYNGVLSTPISLNRYTYANGNPMSYFDPDGRSAILAKVDGGGGSAKKTAAVKSAVAWANQTFGGIAAVPAIKRSAKNHDLTVELDRRLAELARVGSCGDASTDPVLRRLSKEVVVNNFSVLDTAAHGGREDGRISGSDFEAVRDNKRGDFDRLLAWAATQHLATRKSGDPHGGDVLNDEGELREKVLAQIDLQAGQRSLGQMRKALSSKVQGLYETVECAQSLACGASMTWQFANTPIGEIAKGLLNADHCGFDKIAECVTAFGFDIGVAWVGAKVSAGGGKAATEAEVLTGSGPVPGVLEASPRAQSVGAINNWNGKPVEFVFDPESGTFAMGRPAASAGLKGSPHQQLVAAIDGNPSTVVGGIVQRAENGLLTFDEMSGHYWQNWTPQVRQQFIDTMNGYGVSVG